MKSNELFLKRIEEEEFKRSIILKKGNRKIKPNLKGIDNSLNTFYFFKKLKIYCEYLSYQQIVSNEILDYQVSDLILIEPILLIIQNNGYLKEHDIFQVYWYIKELYEKFDSEQQETFTSALNLTHLISSRIDPDEVLELFSFLSNYCIKKLNKGKKEYSKNVLDVNAKMIYYFCYVIKDEGLIEGVFTNIVNTSLKIQDSSFFDTLELKGVTKPDGKFENTTDWTEKFIEEYICFLKKEYQDTYFNYCKAIVQLHKKKFEVAHQLLKKIERTQGLFINLNIKKIFIQVQIERFYNLQVRWKAFSDLEKGLEAYRGIIRTESRKKQLNYQLDLHKEFYNYCKKLRNLCFKQQGYRYKTKAYKKQKELLRSELEASSTNYKIWLIEKVDGLR